MLYKHRQMYQTLFKEYCCTQEDRTAGHCSA